MAKATLEIIEPPAGGWSGKLEFSFNPKEYTISKSAEWARSSSKSAAPTAMPEFNGSGPRSLSLEMFLDHTDSPNRDVTNDVKMLLRCLIPTDESIKKNTPTPPHVRFMWGHAGENFLAFIRSVSAKYTLFRPDGKPIRAVCTLSLEEIPDFNDPQNPTSGSPRGEERSDDRCRRDASVDRLRRVPESRAMASSGRNERDR